MAHGIPLFLAALVIRSPLCCSIRVPSAIEDNSTGSEAKTYRAFYLGSGWDSESVGGAVEANPTLARILRENCENQATRFTKVAVDAACPYLQPVFNPSDQQDVTQFLHFKCDRHMPLRRCYEAIPAGVGLEPKLMPSAKSHWKEFSRLFWPSQGLLDWKGMQNHVAGAIGAPNPSHGWEWLATRTHGNCGNCWSVPGRLADKIAIENRYIKANLGTVPLEDIRSMLDLGGGAGNIAAILNKAYNMTVVSDNGNFGAPFLETVAASGLLSLAFNLANRMPFADGAFDAVHSRSTGLPDVEAFLLENDRIVRPGGHIMIMVQCVQTDDGIQKLKSMASRLALQAKSWKVVATSYCAHLVSAVYQKPKTRAQAPGLQASARFAAAKKYDCATMQCLCRERIAAWKLETGRVGTCPHDAEATWHWISQHCLLFGDVRVAKPSRCAAAAKDVPRAARMANSHSQRSAQFKALAQMGLPLSSDAVRTVLDIEGDGKLVSDLHAAHGTQGMVLSSSLATLHEVASHGVVGLQGPLGVRQPFPSGAFDMIHIGSDCLDKAFNIRTRQQAELQRSLRISMSGDLSVPAPPPKLHELVYEMDRLVRPGGYIVVSFEGQRAGAPAILPSVVRKLGWKRVARKAKGIAFVRPSKRRDQHA